MKGEQFNISPSHHTVDVNRHFDEVQQIKTEIEKPFKIRSAEFHFVNKITGARENGNVSRL